MPLWQLKIWVCSHRPVGDRLWQFDPPVGSWALAQPYLGLDSEWTLVVGGIRQGHLPMSQFGGCFFEWIPAWFVVVGTPQQTACACLVWQPFNNTYFLLTLPGSYSLVHFVTVEDNIYELFPEVLCNCGSGSEHDCRSGMPIFLCPLNVLVLVTGVQSPLSHSLCLLHTTYYSLNVLLLCSPGRLINIECSRSLAVIDRSE